MFQLGPHGAGGRLNRGLQADSKGKFLHKLKQSRVCFCNMQERVTILIEQLRQFGVAEKLLFCPEDLLEKKNIPKVARCLANCVDLVGATCNVFPAGSYRENKAKNVVGSY